MKTPETMKEQKSMTKKVTNPPEGGFRVVRLHAENIKRLKAIELEPDGTFQIIAGNNGQGKSSLLDAMFMALAGGKATKSTPNIIRDGESKAEVTVDLGELVVTRKWSQAGGMKLIVASKDGTVHKSPQRLLDDLIGALSFDPLEFAERLDAKKQKDTLLSLLDIPIDLDAVDAQRKEAYDQRTQVGREGKALAAQLAGHGDPHEGVPDEPISASEVAGRLQEAIQANAHYEFAIGEREQLAKEIEQLKTLLAEKEAEYKELDEQLKKVSAPDVAGLQAQLEAVEETNRLVAHNAEHARISAELDESREAWAELDAKIKHLDETKTQALAGARFPVDGLGFDEDGVTYKGQPFSQASSAEKIRVSTAIAMATNPDLRVIRIMDGSLLDADSMTMLEQMARENGYQVWVERVGTEDTGSVVVIEEGEISEVRGKSKKPAPIKKQAPKKAKETEESDRYAGIPF